MLEKFMPEGDAGLAASETTGRAIDITRQVLYMFALLKIEIVIDLARASLVVGHRSSALLAVLRATGFLSTEGGASPDSTAGKSANIAPKCLPVSLR